MSGRADTKVVIITGANSGIGRETAAFLAAKGCVVYDFSRRDAEAEGVRHMQVDVTDTRRVEEAVAEVIRMEGRVDILINNAGYGISGAIEFTEIQEIRRLFDVNFLGMVRMTKAVLPHMRSRGSGRIVNIGSVAGPISIPFQAYYSASKAAVGSFTLSSANEVRPFGITVCAVMPGDIRTGFTDAREKIHEGDDIYGGRITHSVAVMEKDEREGMDPAAAGRVVGRIALRRGGRPLHAIGFAYKAILLLNKILPAGFVNRVVGRLYS